MHRLRPWKPDTTSVLFNYKPHTALQLSKQCTTSSMIIADVVLLRLILLNVLIDTVKKIVIIHLGLP